MIEVFITLMYCVVIIAIMLVGSYLCSKYDWKVENEDDEEKVY